MQTGHTAETSNAFRTQTWSLFKTASLPYMPFALWKRELADKLFVDLSVYYGQKKMRISLYETISLQGQKLESQHYPFTGTIRQFPIFNVLCNILLFYYFPL